MSIKKQGLKSGTQKALSVAVATMGLVNNMSPLVLTYMNTPHNLPTASQKQQLNDEHTTKIMENSVKALNNLFFTKAEAATINDFILDRYQHITAGDIANNTTIISGGWQSVYSGGIANNTSITSGGAQSLLNGGVANSTYIYSMGHQGISSGGVASATIINSYGVQAVYYGGTAYSTTIENSGSHSVEDGGTSLNIVQNSNGALRTYVKGGADTMITGTHENGSFSLLNGVASNFIINIGGAEYVVEGGIANATILNGGQQVVLNNGITNHTTINSHGKQFLSNGGITNSTTINSGGTQYINNDGTANSVTVHSGGAQIVSAGGNANFVTVKSGGSQTVSSAGLVNAVNVNSGALQHIEIGGTALDIIQAVGGHINTSVVSGATTLIIGTNEKGSFSLINGVANNFILYDGGLQRVLSHGITNSVTINDATQFVYSSGTANHTVINNGGWQRISSGGISNYGTINSGGVQQLARGGIANYTIVNDGGIQALTSLATAHGTIINSGGIQAAASDSSVTSTTINTGGIQYIGVDTTATSTIVNAGGIQIISLGSANSTTINGGQQEISEGTANTTVINNAGAQYVTKSGIATSTTVHHGSQYVFDGRITDTTINSQGVLFLESSAQVTGYLSNTGVIDVSKFSGGNINELSGSGGKMIFNSAQTATTYNKTVNLGGLYGSQTFAISADLVNNTADKLIITGNTSGTHYIQLTKESKLSDMSHLSGATTVVEVQGSHIDTAIFLGKASSIDGVHILPNIVHNGNLWQIVGFNTSASDLSIAAAAAADMSYAALYTSDQILRQRIGDLQTGTAQSGIWVKLSGGELSIESNNMKHTLLRGGYDQVHDTDSGKQITGMILEHFDGAAGYVHNSNGKLKNTRIGAYHTWIGNSGHYYDIVLKLGRLRNHTTFQDIDSTTTGTYNTWNSSFTVEYGYKKPLQHGMFITPLIKFGLGRINAADYTTNSGTSISQQAITSILGKAGISIGQSTAHSRWYLNAMIHHEFAAKSKTTTGKGMFASTIEHNLAGTAFELILGTDIQLSKSGLLYADLSKSFGGKIQNKWQLQLGYRYNF